MSVAEDLGAELEELDALLDAEGALEAQFRALEEGRGGVGGASAGEESAEDPLDAMKRTMGAREPGDSRVVLLACPRCGRKNRTPLGRLRRSLPRCGACGADLSFTP